MGATEITIILALFSSIAGGIFSTAFGSETAYWATQAFAGVLGALSAIIHFFL